MLQFNYCFAPPGVAASAPAFVVRASRNSSRRRSRSRSTVLAAVGPGETLSYPCFIGPTFNQVKTLLLRSDVLIGWNTE